MLLGSANTAIIGLHWTALRPSVLGVLPCAVTACGVKTHYSQRVPSAKHLPPPSTQAGLLTPRARLFMWVLAEHPVDCSC